MLTQQDLEVVKKYFTIYEVKESDGADVIYGDPITDMNVLYNSLYSYFTAQGKSATMGYNLGEFTIVVKKAKKDNIWINVALLVATVITTTFTGALMYGVDIISNPLLIYMGLPFSLAIMLVLGSHELGHYIVSKKRGIDSTLPYFIPFPLPPIGTMGALIRQKGPVPNRKALFDVGISGPMVGLTVAVIITAIGLMLPPVTYASQGDEVVYMQLQTPLLFDFIAGIVHPGAPVDNINPIAFAGWVGMLVTVLNMIPVGQLDGGHVMRAVFGRLSDKLSKIFPLIILGFGIVSTFAFNQQGQVWIFWGLLTGLMGSGMHPKPIDDSSSIGPARIAFAVFAFILVLLCFTPFPISM